MGFQKLRDIYINVVFLSDFSKIEFNILKMKNR